MIQSRIDKMNEVDQIIIKSASVLGDSFQRRMLEAVLPNILATSSVQEGLARLAGMSFVISLFFSSYLSRGRACAMYLFKYPLLKQGIMIL